MVRPTLSSSVLFLTPSLGKPNLNPISVDAPVLVNTTQYGKYFIQNSVSPPLAVVHVYGTPYQMGYAQGELMKDQMNKLIPEVRTICLVSSRSLCCTYL